MSSKQTIFFKNKPHIISAYSIVGKKEGEGPLNKWFDNCLRDDIYDEKTWEKAESKMLKVAILEAVKRGKKREDEIGAILSGDLLNQLMSSSFMARDMQIPFLGIYGACSTMTEAILLGAVLVDGKYKDNIVVGASSHYCTAERQFRMPLEHGNQRPPSSQWTATAAGSMMLSSTSSSIDKNIRIDCGTIGKVIDAGIKDSNNMGCAMAPAAVDTLINHLIETGRDIDYYDIILTGDLGYIGKTIMIDLLKDAGIDENSLVEKCDDCGTMIYEKKQDVHSGGSGCGCSASVFSGFLYKMMKKGEINNALIISTGALLSTISSFQGETIPGIAHAVSLTTEGAN